MSTSCNKTRYISSSLCTLLNKKNNSLDIENDYIILIKDFYIEKSIWGYYYKDEPVSNMNLYVSENDYDNVKNNFKSKILYGSTYSCEFLSWGGPEYINVETYNLNNLLPFSLETLILQLRKYTENICLFLPKNSDLYYIQKLTRNYYPNENYVRVFRTISLNRAKGLLVCWGPIFLDLNVNKFVKYAKEVYPDINIV